MNKSDYNKHIHTMKHLSRIPEHEPIVPAVDERVKDAKLFLCSHCNKAYKSKNGLHYHSKKCVCGAIVDISNEIIPMDISFLEIHEPVLSGQMAFAASHAEKFGKIGHSCENTKIVGRITASFDDIPFSRDSSTDASTTFTASSPNATVLRTSTLGSNLILCDQPKEEEEEDCEYVDEAYHMGVILDLLPEAHENMTEFILYAGSAAVVGVFAYVVFTHLFHYVSV
jgi:hypothetical protein